MKATARREEIAAGASERARGVTRKRREREERKGKGRLLIFFLLSFSIG